VQFEFLMQLQTDAKTMPIEDTTIEWASPFHCVGTINIPSQDFRNPEQLALAEHLSFTPWRALAEHRSLGDQPDPEGRLRRLIGSSASIERRAGTGTGLNRCGA
jgi:hypothetical protein